MLGNTEKRGHFVIKNILLIDQFEEQAHLENRIHKELTVTNSNREHFAERIDAIKAAIADFKTYHTTLAEVFVERIQPQIERKHVQHFI